MGEEALCSGDDGIVVFLRIKGSLVWHGRGFFFTLSSRTLALVSEQQAKVEKLVNEKLKQLELVTATMRQKFVQQQIAAQEAAAAQRATH